MSKTTVTSEISPDSEEGVFSKSEASLPPPPKGRRYLTVASLLGVGIAAWLVVAGLLPSARFAMQGGKPHDIGELASAHLEDAGPWVHGSGQPADTALSYRRRGSRGSYRLTQLEGRNDLWLILSVPEGINGSSYVPPSRFSGRLVELGAAGIHYAPIQEMIRGSASSTKGVFLLLDGERPSAHYDSLLAAFLLALLGGSSLIFAGHLLLRNR